MPLWTGWKLGSEVSKNVMDRWIMSRMNGNITKMADDGYEKYDAPVIVNEAWNFMQDLSTWYVRRSPRPSGSKRRYRGR